MFTPDTYEDWRGIEVVDHRGGRLGTVLEVMLDTDTDRPEWLVVELEQTATGPDEQSSTVARMVPLADVAQNRGQRHYSTAGARSIQLGKPGWRTTRCVAEGPYVQRIRSRFGGTQFPRSCACQVRCCRSGTAHHVHRVEGSWPDRRGPHRPGDLLQDRQDHLLGGRSFQSLKGGYKANHFDVEAGEEYWISGPRRDGADRLYGERLPVRVDDDVRVEHWTEIRNRPDLSDRTDAHL